MNLNAWLDQTRKIEKIRDYEYQRVRPRFVCKDGTMLSVQASVSHYCSPRDNAGPYTTIEVWCVTAPVPESWNEYGGDEPYGYIPIGMVEEFIKAHGGVHDEFPYGNLEECHESSST